MSTEKTIFGKIIDGEIPCTKIYEDSETLAFLDVNPSHVGHTLVVPKKSYKNIFDLPDNEMANLMRVVKKIATAIKTGLSCDGVNVAMNNGEAAGQIVPHAHIHIIPRKTGDRGLPNRVSYKNNEAKEVANKIISAL
ncbi:MAG TPA: HIT family protein [Candidatus Paceibacterota bacterium]|nr:HIT family protein [Candidatus Paceibacterota bacterium]HRZ34271.1 HIT family protein [Candidatus Paceibacterota bacterium]